MNDVIQSSLWTIGGCAVILTVVVLAAYVHARMNGAFDD